MQRLQRSCSWILISLLVVFFGPWLLFKPHYWNMAFAQESIQITRSAPDRTHLEPFSYAHAVKKSAHAVVSIHTQKEIPVNLHPMLRDPMFRFFFGDPQAQPSPKKQIQPALGSGVIVHESGYILTNYHVIQDASSIRISLSDGREADATVVGSDPESDLAVIKTDLKPLLAIPLGHSSLLEVGDIVLAIGNPLGVGQTVTQGIISATKRSNLGINTFENYLQTDAAINPGNSGGALINAAGELIGINTVILTQGVPANLGIGFAIPIDYAIHILEQLIQEGHVIRGWLGVSLRDYIPEQENHDEITIVSGASEGVLVAGITRGGPAHRAGLMPGDVIIHLNHQPIQQTQEVMEIVTALKPGQHCPISVKRGDQIIDFTIAIGKRPLPNTP